MRLAFRGTLMSAALVACTLAAGFTFAQGYPARPVRVIVPFPPGGVNDNAARAIGQSLGQTWGAINSAANFSPPKRFPCWSAWAS